MTINPNAGIWQELLLGRLNQLANCPLPIAGNGYSEATITPTEKTLIPSWLELGLLLAQRNLRADCHRLVTT